jgi:hypothetical protein
VVGLAAVYLALRTAWGIALAVATVRAVGRPGFIWAATTAEACAGILMLAWWNPSARLILGVWVLPMFLYLLAFETIAAVLRWRPMEEAVDAQFSLGGLLAAPALVAWEIGGALPPLLAGAALSFLA